MRGINFVVFMAVLAGPTLAETPAEVMVAQSKLKQLGFLEGKPTPSVSQEMNRALEDAGAKLGFDPNIGSLYEHFSSETRAGAKVVTDPDVTKSVQENVSEQLKDPFSAEFRDIRTLPSGNVCGQVNAKNSLGGYVGWRDFLTIGTVSKDDGKYRAAISFLDEKDGGVYALSCLIDAL